MNDREVRGRLRESADGLRSRPRSAAEERQTREALVRSEAERKRVEALEEDAQYGQPSD